MKRWGRQGLSSTVFILAVCGVAFSSGCTKSEPPLQGKVLQALLKDNVKTADPTNAYDVISSEVMDQVYEAPYQFDYYSDEIKVIPSLAEGMPKISADGKTYTIKIKKGLHFQNDPCFRATQGIGREVKAQDFIYGWKRHANPANESQAFWVWDGKVAGINDFQKKFGAGKTAAEVMREEVEGMRAIDDYTIELKFVRPYPQVMYILSLHFAAPIPPEAVEMYGKDLTIHPVGTGPFKVQSWNPTSRMQMVRNENFRDEYFPDLSSYGKKYAHLKELFGKKLPIADAIDFHVVKEEQPRWLGFLNGKYDQIEIPKDNFSSAIQPGGKVTPDLEAKGISVSIEDGYIFWYVSFNMKDKIVGENKLLRRAFASAIDANAWLNMFKNGRGSVQTEVNPPKLRDRCGKPYKWTFDLARAKKLLAEAGYPEGKGLPVLKWDTRGPDQSERQLAEFVAKSVAAIGIKLEVNVNTFPAYLDKMNKGNLQVSKGGWVMDYPDVENGMQLLYGPNKAPGPNEANFDHEQFNKLYDQMAVMQSGPARKAIVCKMEEIIQDEVPWAYGIYENEYRLIQKRSESYHTAELVLNKYKYLDVKGQ